MDVLEHLFLVAGIFLNIMTIAALLLKLKIYYLLFLSHPPKLQVASI